MYTYSFSDSFITTDRQFEKHINLNRNVPGTIMYSTDFGVKMYHRGRRGEISVPYVYEQKLEGICGNYDYDMTNDFKSPDGTVWPYREFARSLQKSSAFETAVAWKLNGFDGPDPNDIESQCNFDT